MKLTIASLFLFAFLHPLTASAQGVNLSYFDNSARDIGDLILTSLPIVIALGLLFFLWGLAVFILNAGNEEKREQGKKIMIWGVIALFFMITVWGLVEFMVYIFGVDPNASFNAPGIPGINSGGGTGAGGLPFCGPTQGPPCLVNNPTTGT